MLLEDSSNQLLFINKSGYISTSLVFHMNIGDIASPQRILVHREDAGRGVGEPGASPGYGTFPLTAQADAVSERGPSGEPEQ